MNESSQPPDAGSLFARLAGALADHPAKSLPTNGAIPAAVLVPLFCKEGSLHVVLERRSDTVMHHKGQISLPGGAWEAGDQDPARTALREAEEELGIRACDVQILGRLSDLQTISHFVVTPVVARIPYPYRFVPSPGEVAEVLEVPWDVFEEGRGYRVEILERDGREERVHFYHYQHHIIWGATARILRELLSLIPVRYGAAVQQ